jgi:hypothetical protein
MNDNPYESPQTYNAPVRTKRKLSSASIWFAVSIVAWLGVALLWKLTQFLPRDRIWPDRLNADESDLVHSGIAILILICASTAIVAGFAALLAVLRR